MMQGLFSQSFRIPLPSMTQDSLPNQLSRVIIITGGYSGIGFLLAKALYAHHATVFIAGRDTQKAADAILRIHSEVTISNGRLYFLYLDLADLTTIKPAINSFLSQSNRLDMLVNNAGVMIPPLGTETAQGHELQMGTNCLGPYLLTELLRPILEKTAAQSVANSVRVLWAASVATEFAPHTGMDMKADGEPVLSKVDAAGNYSVSKVGNLLLAHAFADRFGRAGVVSVAYNPGNLHTGLQRHMSWWQWAVAKHIMYAPQLGVSTMMFAGWSDAISISNNGSYVVPWGRLARPKDSIVKALAHGAAEKFRSWCDRETARYT